MLSYFFRVGINLSDGNFLTSCFLPVFPVFPYYRKQRKNHLLSGCVQRKALMIFGIVAFTFLSGQISQKTVDQEIDSASEFSHPDISTAKRYSILAKAYPHAEKIGYRNAQLKISVMLMKDAIVMNDFKKADQWGLIAEKHALDLMNFERLTQIQEYRSYIDMSLGLHTESLNEAKKAIFYAKKIPKADMSHYHLSLIFQSIAAYQELKKKPSDSINHYLQQSLQEILSVKNNSPDVTAERKDNQLISIYMNIGSYYTFNAVPPKMDLAEEYFLKVLQYENTTAFKINKLQIYNSVARFYQKKGNQPKAIAYAEKVLQLERRSNAPTERQQALAVLKDAYEKSPPKQMHYLKLYVQLTDSLNAAQKSGIDTSVNRISKQEKKEFTDIFNMTLWLSVISLIAVTIILLVLWRRNTLKMKRNYESAIHHLKANQGLARSTAINAEHIEGEEISKNKTSEIALSTVQSVIESLEKFESSQEFLKAEITLSYLAGYCSTNNRYLAEILKSYKGKSFSRYVNGLRISYLMSLLYHDLKYREYKISYLAEVCGFSSREVFSVVFKKETGMTASFYIEQLKNELKP